MAQTPLYVIGSGLAGLMTALLVAENRPVVVLTKKRLSDTSTEQSQGGIAAVWHKEDNHDLHIKDTIRAGGGLGDLKAISLLSERSREAVERLIQFGVEFDKDAQGEYHLTMEGAHSRPRILHAGGDATGLEIQRALEKAAIHHPNITILENTSLAWIDTDQDAVQGIRYYVGQDQLHKVACQELVLCTGGAGQVYQFTSNPETATGEGMVLAYLAGAILKDLEFFQFHPTALNVPGAPNFLITEAMRGEGAVLRNQVGEAFMANLHPYKDLAPRDVVSRAIYHEMKMGPVSLDATHLGEEVLRHRFPTILRTCAQYGIDIIQDPIPIAPVAHYMMGGVQTDLYGRSNVKGLYVAGEAARTGVHGANRLASNSLLEGAIFAMQVAEVNQRDQTHTPSIWKELHLKANRQTLPKLPETKLQLNRTQFKKLMWDTVGIIREEGSLRHCLKMIGNPPYLPPEQLPQPEFEFQNMLLLGRLMAEAALSRKTSVGSHYRSDSL